MNFYSPWPMLALLIGLFLVAATPLLRAADTPPTLARSRISTLDGLRGFLALAVFFHHGALYHSYIQDRLWRLPPDRLYALLGPFGVSMFFMITGFLFWSQILDKRGKPDWIRLYVGRLFRIGPIYLVAVASMILTVLALTGLRLHVTASTFALQVMDWGLLGLRSGSPINGFTSPGVLLANVTWSLRWEWFFYASLIVTALFARNRMTAWALPALGLVISLTCLDRLDFVGSPPLKFAFVALFCVGMLTAALRPIAGNVDFRKPIFSVITSALIMTVLALFNTAYAGAAICILGAAFFMIANGATLFGLLTSRPARRLGDVSFGIYLFQGLVLSALFATQDARNFSLSSPLHHWAMLTLAALALIAAATIAHALIERPGVALGGWVLQALRCKANET